MTPPNIDEKFSEDDFAFALNFADASNFRELRATGAISAPDGVFLKRPYWRRETVLQTIEIRINAMRAAWGHPPTKLPPDYPIPRMRP
jgi:hypothetical protein